MIDRQASSQAEDANTRDEGCDVLDIGVTIRMVLGGDGGGLVNAIGKDNLVECVSQTVNGLQHRLCTCM